jgi:hypothetical protein
MILPGHFSKCSYFLQVGRYTLLIDSHSIKIFPGEQSSVDSQLTQIS